MLKRDRPEPTEVEAVSPETEAALIGAFENWYADNYNTIQGGGYGDVLSLFSSLIAAYAKEVNSSLVKAKAFSRSAAA